MAPSPQHSSSQVNLWATRIITSAVAPCPPNFLQGHLGTYCRLYWSRINPSQLCEIGPPIATPASWAPRRTEGRQWRTIGYRPCPHYAVDNCKCERKQNLCSNPHNWCCQLLLTWNQKSGQVLYFWGFLGGFCAKQKRLRQQQSASHGRFCLTRIKAPWLECIELQSL